MILKFWPRWPRKWPLNLSSLGGHPLDFNLNGFFQNQWLLLIELSCRLSYLENFHFSNLSAASDTGCWKSLIIKVLLMVRGIMPQEQNATDPWLGMNFREWITWEQKSYKICRHPQIFGPSAGTNWTTHTDYLRLDWAFDWKAFHSLSSPIIIAQ